MRVLLDDYLAEKTPFESAMYLSSMECEVARV
jgi:hypothetical protein